MSKVFDREVDAWSAELQVWKYLGLPHYALLKLVKSVGG